jgi:hypothetical protein
MHQVTGEYPDSHNSKLKNRFYLDADQTFNYSTWSPPIKWKGVVHGVEVEFTQIDRFGDEKDCYDWTDFPENLSSAIPYIVNAIDDAMRVMD